MAASSEQVICHGRVEETVARGKRRVRPSEVWERRAMTLLQGVARDGERLPSRRELSRALELGYYDYMAKAQRRTEDRLPARKLDRRVADAFRLLWKVMPRGDEPEDKIGADGAEQDTDDEQCGCPLQANAWVDGVWCSEAQ